MMHLEFVLWPVSVIDLFYCRVVLHFICVLQSCLSTHLLKVVWTVCSLEVIMNEYNIKILQN